MFRSLTRLRFNQVTLIGRISQPEIKTYGTDKSMAIINLATNTFQTVDGETVEETSWHRVISFKPYLIEYVEKNITKGTLLLVQGKLKYNTYEDKEQKRHTSVSIVADTIKKLGGGEQKEQ